MIEDFFLKKLPTTLKQILNQNQNSAEKQREMVEKYISDAYEDPVVRNWIMLQILSISRKELTRNVDKDRNTFLRSRWFLKLFVKTSPQKRSTILSETRFFEKLHLAVSIPNFTISLFTLFYIHLKSLCWNFMTIGVVDSWLISKTTFWNSYIHFVQRRFLKIIFYSIKTFPF